MGSKRAPVFDLRTMTIGLVLAALVGIILLSLTG